MDNHHSNNTTIMNGQHTNGHTNGISQLKAQVNGSNGVSRHAALMKTGIKPVNIHKDSFHSRKPCCDLEKHYDGRRDEGIEFLKQVSDLCLNEGIAEKLDRNTKVVEFLSPEEVEKSIDLSLENDPVSQATLMDVCCDVMKYSVKTGHPHFMNQLFGGFDPYGLTGAWLTEFLNPSQYTFEVAPVFTIMENVLFKEMCKLFQIGDGDGIFCPGGSMSNMYAINLARYRMFPESKTKGMFGLPELCIATSERGHYSLKKGAAFLGFGHDNLLLIKVDDKGRMIPAELDAALTNAKAKGKVPIMVNATAGSTVMGAYDPLVPISEICQKHGVWFHVDGAWGGAVIMSDKLKYKLEGVSRADSITMNPHKLLGATQQASMFMTKHKDMLRDCHSANAKYLFQQDKFYDVSYDTGDKSLQCGRKVDVLKVWLMWKAKGKAGFAAQLEHMFHCAGYLTKKLADRQDYKLVLEEPECTNVCFWYIPPRLQGKEETPEWWQEISKVAPEIKRRLVMNGSLLIGYQPEGDKVNFFRFVLTSSAAKLEDMDYVVDEISRLGCDL